MLSAGPLSGLSRAASASHPVSALAAPRTSASAAPGLTRVQHQHQHQRRLLSIPSEDSQEPTEEHGSAAAEEGVAEAEAEAEIEAAGETAVEEENQAQEPEASKSEPLHLLQVDGLPFHMPQEEIEQWFADAGCAPSKITLPLWAEQSMRAGQNKGKAYLHFDSEEDTQTVLAMSGRSMGERWINISRLAIPIEEVRLCAGDARRTMRRILFCVSWCFLRGWPVVVCLCQPLLLEVHHVRVVREGSKSLG